MLKGVFIIIIIIFLVRDTVENHSLLDYYFIFELHILPILIVIENLLVMWILSFDIIIYLAYFVLQHIQLNGLFNASMLLLKKIFT